MLSVASLELETQSHDSATSSPSLNQEAHIFTSKFPPIPISNNRPLHTYCFENISNVADKTCLIVANSGKTYSYSETHLISKRVAVGLTRLGIGKGDVVMVLLQNSAEFVFTFMGASMIGAATTMANPFCTAKEILKQFKLSGAKMIVTQSIYVDKLKEGGEEEFDFTVVTVDGDREGCIHFSELSGADESAFREIEIEIDANDAVAIPFSSGTTGLPKGVILTHKSLITNVAQQVDGENPNLYLQQNDVALCVLPLFHIFALNSVLLCSLRRGASVLLVPKFEIQSFLDLMQRYRVTVAAVVPPLVLALTKNPIVDSYDLSAVRMVHSGAAPLGKDLEAALLRRLPQVVFGQGYGMTEAGPVLTMCPAFAKKPLSTKSGSCGAVIRNAELMVIDPKTGCSLPRNQPGELCIRGSQLMKEYLKDPEATARTIDIDGWLHTGDIGYVDDDDDVFIVDRAKELIKFKGFQVPPAELEALLISHPEIDDAAVVPQKDEAAGEVPVAFVVQNGFQLTEEAVKDFISKQVVFYKRLHKVYFVHAIPKSPSGKILRKELRAKLASAS